MNATRRIMGWLTLALALTMVPATLGIAAEWTGSDYESGRIPEATIAVKVPAGFHINAVANGTDFENGTIGLPEGAKGGELLEVQSLAERGERMEILNGSDYENGR